MAGTRGYFIMKNGKLADASVEMEGSSGQGGGVDHYGYALALDNRKLFGIPDDLADRALGLGKDSSMAMDLETQGDYFKIWSHIESAILARVCTLVKTSNTGKPDITVQIFRKVSHKAALRLVQGWILHGQVPDAPANSQVSVEIGHGDSYIAADNVREFLSAEDPRQLKIG